MKASLINSSFRKGKVPVGTVMALLQPSGVSLDTKKEKEAVPLQPTEEKNNQKYA
jgi:hypothetical protein